MKTILIIFMLTFTALFSACAQTSEYHISKEEITLKTTATKTGELISFLGTKDNKDYIVINSEHELISARFDDLKASIKPCKIALPYESKFYKTYCLSAQASLNANINLCYELADNKPNCIEIRKLYKSLNYRSGFMQ